MDLVSQTCFRARRIEPPYLSKLSNELKGIESGHCTAGDVGTRCQVRQTTVLILYANDWGGVIERGHSPSAATPPATCRPEAPRTRAT